MIEQVSNCSCYYYDWLHLLIPDSITLIHLTKQNASKSASQSNWCNFCKHKVYILQLFSMEITSKGKEVDKELEVYQFTNKAYLDLLQDSTMKVVCSWVMCITQQVRVLLPPPFPPGWDCKILSGSPYSLPVPF